MKDLLFAQAVCKIWKAFIATKASLQKALLFRPVTTSAARYFRGDEPELSCYYIGGPEREALLCNDDDDDDTAILDIEDSSLFHECRVFVNPLLLAKFHWFNKLFGSGEGLTHLMLPYELYRDEDLSATARHTKASWRRMLITQPPRRELSGLLGDGLSILGWSHIISSDRNITMAILRKAIQKRQDSTLYLDGSRRLRRWASGRDLVRIDLPDTMDDVIERVMCGDVRPASVSYDSSDYGYSDPEDDSDTDAVEAKVESAKGPRRHRTHVK